MRTSDRRSRLPVRLALPPESPRPPPPSCLGGDPLSSHRRGLARPYKLEIACVHGADNHTNINASSFQYRALLDMSFQPIRPSARGRNQRTGLHAVTQCASDADAIIVSGSQCSAQLHITGEHATAHHRWLEPTAFFICPVH